MRKLRTMHLFAGAGGGILADLLLRHQPVCAVEIDEYCQQVLSARQADGTFPWFPIFADVTKFDGRPWRGVVDVVCGGFPCQDISAAGGGSGIDGERSGLWREMARIVGEIRPRFVFVENSPLLVGRGLAVVLGDFADMGYDAQWFRLSASNCGAPHQRDRCWLVAYADRLRELQPQGLERDKRGRVGNVCSEICNTPSAGLQERVEITMGRSGALSQPERSDCYISREWPPEPGLGRVVDGMAHRAHRIKALGNGQVPRVAAAAFAMLLSRERSLMQPLKGED